MSLWSDHSGNHYRCLTGNNLGETGIPLPSIAFCSLSLRNCDHLYTKCPQMGKYVLILKSLMETSQKNLQNPPYLYIDSNKIKFNPTEANR
jgi:hypothetical protein